jgi:hypothetical protein
MTHNLYNLHKYSFISNQAFSSKFFLRIFKTNEVIKMQLKGWPFEPLGDVKPLGGGGSGAGPGPA